MSTRGFEIAAWMQAKLPDPADHRRPLVLTPGQIDFLAQWYELDATGRAYTYRRAALQQPKGWGKSPLAAMMAIAELVGPVLPDGKAWSDPLVQIAALSEDQADSNVFSLCRELLVANDGRAANELGIDVGRTRFYLRARAGKLEAVTADAGSREGQRLTFAIIDETHLWTKRNGGLALARTLRRNAGKMGGRVIETSNAPELGYGSVAEATLEDVAAGHPGMLLVARRPSLTPEPTMGDDELLGLLREVYFDAHWIDVNRILQEVRDPGVPFDEATRYYFNSPAGGASVLAEPSVWDALRDPSYTEPIPGGTRIGVGIDPSHSQDGTAIVICDETGRLYLALLIERNATDPPEWTVPRGLVHEVIDEIFQTYEVARLLADPYNWRSEIEGWARQYGEDIVGDFPTNSIRRFGPAVDRFRAALVERAVAHDGDLDLRRHVLNARLLRGAGAAADGGHALFTLEKPGPRRLIDAAVAGVLAYEAISIAAPLVDHPILVAYR